MPLAEGTRFGPYEIRRAIGAGGMGEVYEAIDTRLDRLVAIKVLPADRAADHDARARFDREARAIAALNHPNICALYDIGQSEGHDYLVMELLEGESLQQRLARGALDPDAIVNLGLSLADALGFAHARGLIHRDLKPANIFLTVHGAPKILDFGLAKTLVERDLDVTRATRDLTGLGAALGTVAYMSPEQLRGEPLDARTDLFSLGLVLYEMATGQGAFAGSTGVVVAAAILAQAPQPPRAIRPGLPAGLDEVLLKSLEKDRERRYQTAEALRADLLRVRNEAPRSTDPEPAVPPAPAPRSRVGIAAGLSLAILAAATAAYMMVGQRGATVPEPAVSSITASPVDASAVPVAGSPPSPAEPAPQPEPPAPVAPSAPETPAAPAAAAGRGDPVAPPDAPPVSPPERVDDSPGPGSEPGRAGRGRGGRGVGLPGLATSLRGLPPLDYDLVVQAGDETARDMAEQLQAALTVGGWNCVNRADMPVGQPGLAVFVPAASQGATALVTWARRSGFAPAYRVTPALPRVRIVVGTRRPTQGGEPPQANTLAPPQ